MIEKITTIFKPNTDQAKVMMERAVTLAQAQLDVSDDLYGAFSKEYRDLLGAEDPSVMFRNWPKFIESNTRNVIQSSATMLKNSVNFQQELMQMMQVGMPEWNQQLVNSIIETTRAAGTMANVSAGRAQQRTADSGVAHGARASKAA